MRLSPSFLFRAVTLFFWLGSGPLRAADQRFLVERPPAPIYHEGWIDLNKNGTRDPTRIPPSRPRRASRICWPG